ncbi:hypothetical protein ES707_00213 [subsurface metagenome]
MAVVGAPAIDRNSSHNPNGILRCQEAGNAVRMRGSNATKLCSINTCPDNSYRG